MTSRQHQNWINKGRQDSGLVKPLALLRDLLRAAGYTVYDFPNAEHLDHVPPEDHTYYSETNWPGGQELWWRHAIDIMPPPAGSSLPSLQTIGQRLYDARQAGGITWLKYMNWPSTGDLAHAVQDRWEPSHARSSSSDAGHIHLSSTTGVQTLSSSFNPLTSVILAGSVTPDPSTTSGDDDVPAFLAKRNTDGALFICDGKGIAAVPVTVASLADTVTLINEGLEAPVVGIGSGPGVAAPKGSAKVGSYFPRTGFNEPAFGQIQVQTPAPPVDPAALQAAVTAALKAVGVSVSPAQVAAVLVDPQVQAILIATAEAGANKAETE